MRSPLDTHWTIVELGRVDQYIENDRVFEKAKNGEY